MAVIEATEDAGLDPGGNSCFGEERKELGSSLRWNQRQEVRVRKGGGEACKSSNGTASGAQRQLDRVSGDISSDQGGGSGAWEEGC